MLNDSLAPIKRAFAFFGIMGAVVATLTFGSALQSTTDQSSTSVAEAKIRNNIPTDTQLASVDPAQRVADRTKRAIATSQEARVVGPVASVVR